MNDSPQAGRLPPSVTLFPLSLELHIELLQAVYLTAPSYWQLYEFSACPAGQAENDLTAAHATPGRTLMGIAQQIDSGNPSQGAEMIGMLDFRQHWPTPEVVSLGMIMVAESHQRRGVGRAAWMRLEPWLVQSARMRIARLGVEQFNPGALRFFAQLGFQVTGEANRLRVGDQLVRLLTMEKALVAG